MNNNELKNIFDLQEAHKNLLTKYLTFFKSKQDKFVREIKLEIEDYQNQNVKEMMFSKTEVIDLVTKLKENLSSQMENEMSYFVNMNAIFIQLLLHSADEKNTILSVETSQVQNMKNINEMNQFVSSIMGVNIPEFGKKNSISKLGSISKTQNLIDDFESLKHEHEMLNQNLSILKMQNELLVKENKNLQEIKGNSDEVKVLREKLITLSVEKNDKSDKQTASTLEKLQSDLEITKSILDEQVTKYQTLLKEFDVKLSESSQFQQLKKFLQEKNALIIELKKKIAEYEDK